MGKKVDTKSINKRVTIVFLLVCLFAAIITLGYSAFQSGMNI